MPRELRKLLRVPSCKGCLLVDCLCAVSVLISLVAFGAGDLIDAWHAYTGGMFDIPGEGLFMQSLAWR